MLCHKIRREWPIDWQLFENETQLIDVRRRRRRPRVGGGRGGGGGWGVDALKISTTSSTSNWKPLISKSFVVWLFFFFFVFFFVFERESRRRKRAAQCGLGRCNHALQCPDFGYWCTVSGSYAHPRPFCTLFYSVTSSPKLDNQRKQKRRNIHQRYIFDNAQQRANVEDFMGLLLAVVDGEQQWEIEENWGTCAAGASASAGCSHPSPSTAENGSGSSTGRFFFILCSPPR